MSRCYAGSFSQLENAMNQPFHLLHISMNMSLIRGQNSCVTKNPLIISAWPSVTKFHFFILAIFGFSIGFAVGLAKRKITSYNNIALVYYNTREHSKALSFYEKAFEISQKTLPSNHSDIATYYNNIGLVCYTNRQYSKALSYLKRALEIRQHSLPSNHPDIQRVQKEIEIVKNSCKLMFNE
jgi:tetratricopeptide (TPR) repeat protein